MICLLDDHMPYYRSHSLLEPAWYPAASRKRSLLDDLLETSAASLLGSAARPSFNVGKKPGTKVGNGAFLSLRFDKKQGAYTVEAPTPGVKRDELKIEIVGDRQLELTIEQGARTDDSSTQQQKQDDENTSMGSHEGASNFVRRMFGSILLPEDADTSSAHVEYADGLLRVVFAKLSEGDKNKLAIELDAEHAGLEQEASSRLDKVKELRAKLEAELAEAAKAEESLRRARAEALQRRSKKRQRLL
jgi:HSP20 family molecular chaperone IbpA